ncbi:hypothetical protein ACJMK2_042382 [Sinanodonta woodiana]|uniref:Enhancer of mRNA-decapping protein 4 C-terminal domain-containing protein n=3 Tax=Sinanodonta woodiana TaxID=1069815 RepID=A0ABD3W762_SINWO
MKVGGKTTYLSKASVEEFQLQTIMSTWGMEELQMNEHHQRILKQQELQPLYQCEQETFLQMAQKSERSMKEQMNKLEGHVSFSVEHLFLHAQWNNVKKSLEPLKEQIHWDMVELTSAAIDSLRKDDIAKMVFSQQTIDAFGMVVGNAVSTSVQAAYLETFKNIIIPSFERATRALMDQVYDAFQNGIGELLEHLDTQLDQDLQNQFEACFPNVFELQQMTYSFQSLAERMLSHVQATLEMRLKSELQSSLSGMQKMIAHYLMEAVREEVSMAVKEMGNRISDSVLNATRSESKPVIQVMPNLQEPKPQILQLLQQGQINTAFDMALSACNLEMVMFVCEMVNFSEVFEKTPCPLQQRVLLSLIQQLSVDLGSNTELKNKFIQGAMVNLDKSDPVVQDHLTSVIFALVKHVEAFVEKHPRMIHQFKMVRLAAKALIK